MTKRICENIVRNIVEALSRKDYDAIFKNDFAQTMYAADMESLIAEYGGRVTLPPDEAYHQMKIYDILGRDEVSVDFDLWIDDVKSDLTLIVSIKNLSSVAVYSVQDIHVL